jgi:hypothetical protein
MVNLHQSRIQRQRAANLRLGDQLHQRERPNQQQGGGQPELNTGDAHQIVPPSLGLVNAP